MSNDLQLRGVLRLTHSHHFIVWHICIGVLLALLLHEPSVQSWSWANSFAQRVALVVPTVDAFWRVSPFPATAKFLPAVLWSLAAVSGPLALLTVQYRTFPAALLPRRSRRFVLFALGVIAVIVLFAIVGWSPLVPEDRSRTRYPVALLMLAAKTPWLFGLLAGIVSGVVAALWAALLVALVARRTPTT